MLIYIEDSATTQELTKNIYLLQDKTASAQITFLFRFKISIL